MSSQLNRSRTLLAVVAMLLSLNAFSQKKNQPVEGGYFFKNKWASNFVGIPIDLDNSDLEYSALSPYGDTIVVKNAVIRKMYTDKDIIVFPDRKFHYKNSGILEHTYTFGAQHFSWDFKYLRSFSFPLEVGIGTGIQSNSLEFPTGSSYFFVNVLSFPLYIQATYKALGRRNKIYLKGAFGIANNRPTGSVPIVTNHIYARGGVGVLFSSRNRFKHFVEFGQSYSGVSGEAQSMDDNVLGTVKFNNVKFYRFTVTYGFQLGK